MSLKFKRILSVLLSSILLFSVLPLSSAAADVVDSGTCGTNVSWSLDSEGLLLISGSGNMKDYSAMTLVPWYKHRVKITAVTIGEGVTSIGKNAFNGCGWITTLDIPDSVTSIGERAIYNCNSVISYNVGDNNPVYADDDGVLFSKDRTELIRYPAKKTGSYAIPASVMTLADRAFFACSLTSAVIPDTVVNFGSELFSFSENLTAAPIPGSVTRIPNSMFNNCTALESVTIPSHIKEIGSEVFSCCSNLKTAELPEGLTCIDERAFYQCGKLENVVLPQGLKTLGAQAFGDCLSLRSVNVPGGITDFIGNVTGGNGSSGNFGGSGLESVTVEAPLTTIPMQMFSACRSLKNVFLPETLVSLANGAFENCAALESIAIPAGVTSIGSTAFYYCTSLKEIVLPGDLQTIGKNAFKNCDALKYAFYPCSESDWQNVDLQGDQTYDAVGLPRMTILHYNMTVHTPIVTEVFNETTATCILEGGHDENYVCAQDGCDYEFETAHITISVDPTNHVNTIDEPESDSTETEHGYTAGVYCSDCGQYISGHIEKPLIGEPEEPTTEPEEPTTEPEEPTTEEPVSEPEPTAPVSELVTDSTTEPSTEPTTIPTTAPAAPTGANHGARCFCYTYNGNGLMANIVRFICATYNFLWNLFNAIG